MFQKEGLVCVKAQKWERVEEFRAMGSQHRECIAKIAYNLHFIDIEKQESQEAGSVELLGYFNYLYESM